MIRKPIMHKSLAAATTRGTEGVRTFEEQDIPEIAHLVEKLFPRSSADSIQVKQEILKQLLLESPWDVETMPSLVYENSEGKVKGFLGIAPRTMEYRGERIKAAISYNLMVDPEERSSMAGLQMLQAFFEGPQDLSIADSATDISRQLWESLGGTIAPLYSIYWKYPLRPAGFAAYYLKKKTPLSSIIELFSPVSKTVDWLIGKAVPFNGEQNENVILRDLSISELVQYIDQFSDSSVLRPIYNEDSMDWVLSLARKPKRFGDLKTVGLFDAQDTLLGWMVFYQNRGGACEILQLKTAHGEMGDVIKHFFSYVRNKGAVGISGRLDPDLISVLKNYFCFYTPGRMWMLIDSDRQDLIKDFKAGNAFLSRLEGDMWLL